MARWLCFCCRGQSAPASAPTAAANATNPPSNHAAGAAMSDPPEETPAAAVGDLAKPPAIAVPTIKEQQTTLEDLDRLLDDIKQQLQLLEQQAGQPSSSRNPITRVGSEWDKYKSQTTYFMETAPAAVIAQINDTRTLYILPLLTQALGGLGGVHWMAFGFSVISWFLETVNTAAQNQESCIQILRKTVELLAYTNDVWRVRGDESDEELKSVPQHSVEMAFRCAMVCCSTVQAGAMKDVLSFLNSTNIEMSMSTAEKQLDEALGKIRAQLDQIRYTEGPRLRRDVSSLGVPGKLRVGGDGVIQDAIGFMDTNVGNVLLVALKGMGGIGKSTLGDAIFNHFLQKKNADGKKQYQCCSVTVELGIKGNGLCKVQEEILEKLSKSRPKPISRLTEGVTQLHKELGNIKEPVFLYIDNVLEYGESWLPRTSTFPKGSRILVTTRNEHVYNSLAYALELEQHAFGGEHYRKLIEVKPLDKVEAKKLLHTQFRMQQVDYTQEEMETLEMRVLELCDGLPLALEVVGSFIAQHSDEGPKATKVWKEVIEAMLQACALNGEAEDQLYSNLRFSIANLDEPCRQAFLDVVAYAIGSPWAAAERLVGPRLLDILRKRSLVSKAPPEGRHGMAVEDDDGDDVPFRGRHRSRLWQVHSSSVVVHDVLVKMGMHMLSNDSEEIRIIDENGWDICYHDPIMLAKVVGLVDVHIIAQQLQQMDKLRLLGNVKIMGECLEGARLGNLRIASKVIANSSKPFNLKGCKLKEISWMGSDAISWSMKVRRVPDALEMTCDPCHAFRISIRRCIVARASLSVFPTH